MKKLLSWLLAGVLIALGAWLLYGMVQQYLLDARNAQG